MNAFAAVASLLAASAFASTGNADRQRPTQLKAAPATGYATTPTSR